MPALEIPSEAKADALREGRLSIITPCHREVKGEMFIHGKLDLHHFLVKELEQFFPIGTGTARLALAPDITFEGEAFLVNKELAGFFGVTQPPSMTTRI